MRHSLRVLTALVVTVTLTGCFSGTDEAPPAPETGILFSNLDDLVPADAKVWSGTVEGDAVGYAAEEFTLQVPQGAAAVHAIATWDAAAPLQLRLQPPGAPTISGTEETPGNWRAVSGTAPEAGTWTVRVVSANNAPHAFTVTAWVSQETSDVRVDEKIALKPGEFVEVNVALREGAVLQWAFDADDTVLYDVHSHVNNERTVHTKGTELKRSGAFTVPEDNVYSVYLASADGEPVTVSYAVRGAMHLHSRVYSRG